MQTALDMFRPTEHQEEFFRAMERVDIIEMLLGGGNRAGKSVAAAICLASLVLDKPVTFRDGSKHYMRPGRWRDEPLKIWLIGYDWRHIGKTFYRLLFMKGLYKIIRDSDTGVWRSWDPSNPADADRFDEARPSPPLIRMMDVVSGMDGISWENKKENQFQSCDFVHDGSRIEVFPSTGAAPQGDPVHYIWIDEKIDADRLYNELKVRTIDYRGRIVWTAWPDTAPSDAMAGLSDRAEDQAGKPKQRSFAIRLRGQDNIYTQSDHRDAIFAGMDEEERLARDQGVMNNDRWRMYPRFNKYFHRAYGPDQSKDDKLAAVIRAKNGIPSDFTRYLILDPGTAHPAILFVAVPPPELGDFVVPYDEIYIPYTSAEPLAKACAAKLGITDTYPGDVIEEMIADFRACRQTPLGFDGTVGQNYEKYFAKEKIRSRRHGTRFTPGSDNVKVRIMRVQGMMNIRPDGTSRLRILGCKNLVKQLEQARWAKTPKDEPDDVPAKYQHIDLPTCLEYFGSRDDCGYFKPPPIVIPDGRSPEEVRKSFSKFFGVSPQQNDKTIYCGPGGVS